MPRTKQNANLKRGNPPTQFKSGQNAVENGRKGGINSGKSKRLKKSIAEMAKTFAALPVTAKQKKLLKEYDLSSEDMVQQMLLVAAMFEKGAQGNVKAAELITKWLIDDSNENKKGVLEDILDAVRSATDD